MLVDDEIQVYYMKIIRNWNLLSFFFLNKILNSNVIYVRNLYLDGLIPKWANLACAGPNKRPISTGVIM